MRASRVLELISPLTIRQMGSVSSVGRPPAWLSDSDRTLVYCGDFSSCSWPGNKEHKNMRAPASIKSDLSPKPDPLASNMGNISGRETEATPPPPELPPVLGATAQPFHYGRALPRDDTLQGRGAPQVQHPRPCSFYVRGTCFRGTACRFSHETAMNVSSTKNSRVMRLLIGVKNWLGV